MVVVLEGLGKHAPEDELAVTEELAAEGAVPRVVGIARQPSQLLDVPLSVPDTATVSSPTEVEGAQWPPLAFAHLARFTLRSEGARVVLRDYGSLGPRAAAAPKAVVGVVFCGVAVAMAYALVQASLSGGSVGEIVAYGGLTALMGVSSYTFASLAWFAAKYSATSEPLVAVGADKLVVRPWVARDGTVDVRNDGRYGAAIPLGEVTDVAAVPRGGRTAVEIQTDHGPIRRRRLRGGRYGAGPGWRVRTGD